MISLELEGSTLKASTPYNANFVSFAQSCGAKWSKPYWVFDARDRARVQEKCLAIFGSDGTTHAELVTLKVQWLMRHGEGTGPIIYKGRTIAMATSRDSGARLGDGVVVLAGGFGSGGSVKNWETTAQEGTEILLRDVPKVQADATLAAQEAKPDNYRIRRFNLVEEAPVLDLAALAQERERLLARVAELDDLLATGPTS